MTKIFSLIRYLGVNLFYPILWTIIVIALLCIPGKSLPGMGLFGIKNIDKPIHMILFGAFVVLWAIYAWENKSSELGWRKVLLFICLLSITLGVVMEFVQAEYIPQRSFDIWDIWSDLIGSLLFAYLLLKWGSRWKLLL